MGGASVVRAKFFLLIFLSTFVLLLGNFYDLNAEASKQTLTTLRALDAKRYTVQIDVQASDVFVPEVKRWKGTGFIVSLSETEGFLFTNRHVVDSETFHATKITLRFNLDRGSEQIPGSLVYKSRRFDFAVVKFDPRKLKKAQKQLSVASLPDPKDYLELIDSGRAVMAYGHPLNTQNNATFGSINGYAFGKDWEISTRRFWGGASFVRTDAAINPGNSGGPLVDVETGLIVGINTAIIKGANNHGFVTPIAPLIEEWKHARLRGKAAHDQRYVLLSLTYLGIEKLKLESALFEQVAAEIPTFENVFDSVPMVLKSADPGLQTGDIILQVNGEPIGDQAEKISWLAEATSTPTLKVKVLRNNRPIEAELKVYSTSLEKSEDNPDYLMSSGLVFQNMSRSESFELFDGSDAVIVQRVIPHSIGAQMTELEEYTVITAAFPNGVLTPVKNIEDLERVFRSVEPQSYLRLVVAHPARDGGDSSVLMMSRASFVYSFPVDGIVSGKELPLSKLKKEFDFSGKDLGSRQIQSRIGNASCPVQVASLAQKS